MVLQTHIGSIPPSVSADTHPAQPSISSESRALMRPVDQEEPGLLWYSTSTCNQKMGLSMKVGRPTMQ